MGPNLNANRTITSVTPLTYSYFCIQVWEVFLKEKSITVGYGKAKGFLYVGQHLRDGAHTFLANLMEKKNNTIHSLENKKFSIQVHYDTFNIMIRFSIK